MLFEFGRGTIPGEAGGALAADGCEVLVGAVVGEEGGDGFKVAGCVGGVDQERGVGRDLRDGGGIACDDWGAAGHGFHDGQAEALVARGEPDDGCGAVQGVQGVVGDEAKQVDATREAAGCLGVDGIAVIDDGEDEIGEALEKQRSGLEDEVGVFAEVQTSGDEDEGAGVEADGAEVVETGRRDRAEEVRCDAVIDATKAGADGGEEVSEAIGGELRDGVEEVDFLLELSVEEGPFEARLPEGSIAGMGAVFEVAGIVCGDDEPRFAGGHIRLRGAEDDLGVRPEGLSRRAVEEEPACLLATGLRLKGVIAEACPRLVDEGQDAGHVAGVSQDAEVDVATEREMLRQLTRGSSSARGRVDVPEMNVGKKVDVGA